MATANEIESYKGDSALAGGFGAQNMPYVIGGAWKMIDSVNESFSLLRAQQFQKSQEEYKQKIKDRDALGAMIESDELNVDKLTDEDRMKENAKIDEFRNSLIKASKDGNLSKDETFLGLKKQFAEIKGGINNKNVNNIAFEADQKKYANQFDNNYEKHQAKEKELMGKDPNHKYQPYVPLFKYDEKKIFTPLITDKKETPVGQFKKKVVETPNIIKTFDDTGAFYTTQNGRKEVDSAYDDFVNGGDASVALLDNINKKLEGIALTLPEDQRALLKPIDLAIDNKPMVIAKQRIAMGWDKVDTKPKEIYKDEQSASADLERMKTDQNIRQEQSANAGRMSLKKLEGAQAIELAKLKAGLENAQKEYELRLKNKYSKEGNGGMTDEQIKAKSELMKETFNAIKKQIEESETLDEKEKVIELQRLKNSLDKNEDYKIGGISPWAELAKTMNDLLKETRGVAPQSDKKVEKENNQSPKEDLRKKYNY